MPLTVPTSDDTNGPEVADMRLAAAYMAALAIFVVVDFVWLGFVMKDFYRASIGHLMGDSFNIPAAIAFYLIYVAGIVVFAVNPAFTQGDVLTGAVSAFGYAAAKLV